MLRLRDLTVAYDHPVLRGVDLEVAAGEILCILGPSGGGKSTMLRAVAGLVPAEGLIEVAGKSMAGVPPHRRGIGMMFQDDLLFPHLDVAADVGFGLDPPDGQRGSAMLELVGLAGFGTRSVDTLSGGQSPRVAMARALAPQPRLLLPGEPFGSLRVVLKAGLVLDVQRVLRELGMTVLAVTHDRQEAFTLADRVAVLREGRLAQVGTPDELWNDPADTYVARLVGLSVLGGRAFRPEDIHATPDGSWDAVVTGRTFRDGHHLITARVDEESVVFVSQVPLETGDEIRLAAD